MKVQALARIENRLRIIDQTKLPNELVYKELDNYRDIIRAIKELQVRGAPAIGIAAAYALAVAAEENPIPSFIREAAIKIKSARPTAVNLSWAVDRVMEHFNFVSPDSEEEIKRILWQEAEVIHDDDRLMCEKIGIAGAELITNGETILTHCNTGALATGGIGTASGIIYTAHDQGKKIQVFADETRPLMQGARLTAWELQQAGIDVTLITDNTAGFLMAQGKIDRIIVGADRIASNGDTANKIGTYSLALMAVGHQIPFWVAAPMSTFDNDISSGDEIIIEQRSAGEVTSFGNREIAPKDIKVYSPSFDITPNELISLFITDQGIRLGGRKT